MRKLHSSVFAYFGCAFARRYRNGDWMELMARATTRRSPGAAQAQPGAARCSQAQSGAARRSQAQPGAARRSQASAQPRRRQHVANATTLDGCAKNAARPRPREIWIERLLAGYRNCSECEPLRAEGAAEREGTGYLTSVRWNDTRSKGAGLTLQLRLPGRRDNIRRQPICAKTK